MVCAGESCSAYFRYGSRRLSNLTAFTYGSRFFGALPSTGTRWYPRDVSPSLKLMSDFPYAPTLIAKGRAHALYYARGLYKEIAAKNLFLWAQAIAFKVLVTVVPIVILATGLAGRILRGNDAFAAVARFIYDFLPPSQSQQVVNFLHQLQVSSGTIVGIGGIGLFLSAVSLFITLRIAVGNAFEQDWHEGRSVIGGYLFDVRMVLQVGVLFLITIGMSVFVQSVEGPDILSFAGMDQPWAREGWQRAIQTTGLFVPFFITTAMFFQLYYLVPKPHPRKRSAFIGAMIAGVLWEMAKQIFTYYATYVGQFERYATEGLGAIGNTFALIIAFVFWIYFSGIVLMLGAVVASLHEHRYVTSGLLPGERPSNISEMPSTKPATRDTSEETPDTSESRKDEPSPARRPTPTLTPSTHTDAASRSHEALCDGTSDQNVDARTNKTAPTHSNPSATSTTDADSANVSLANTTGPSAGSPDDATEPAAPPESTDRRASDSSVTGNLARNGAAETERDHTDP